jgi:hypothetical protein
MICRRAAQFKAKRLRGGFAGLELRRTPAKPLEIEEG